MAEARRLIVSGRVQGVGFRYFLRAEAARLGATGWVRNRADGTVEAVVAGTPVAIAGLLAAARRGPPGARVDHLAVEFAEGDFTGFEARPTVA